MAVDAVLIILRNNELCYDLFRAKYRRSCPSILEQEKKLCSPACTGGWYGSKFSPTVGYPKIFFIAFPVTPGKLWDSIATIKHIQIDGFAFWYRAAANTLTKKSQTADKGQSCKRGMWGKGVEITVCIQYVTELKTGPRRVSVITNGCFTLITNA
jgi:hypothetical protein